MKKNYDSYNELKEDCVNAIGKDYFMIKDFYEEHVGDIVVIEPVNYFEGGRDLDRIHPNRDLPVYVYADGNKLEFFDRTELVEKLTSVLKEYVDQEMVMKDLLEDQPLSVLEELRERLFKKDELKKATIKTSPGCYEITIGGKRGAPFSLMLRE